MLRTNKNQRRSLSKPFEHKELKLPFLKNRERTLIPSPISPTFSEIPDRKPVDYPTPKSQLQKFAENLTSGILSLDIPQLRYSAFKKSPETFKQNRRKSDFGVVITDQLLAKYNIHPSDVKHPSVQLAIKESIINKKPFKRIEPGQIEGHSRNLGQKLIRVQELVIDPLMIEGEFN